MLAHYFKIATRNLLKYKQQTVISIIGLAIGFTCFALSMLWIRYEMSYDNFHEGTERIFVVRTEDKMSNDGLSPVTPYPLAAYFQETFPEIEYACNTIGFKNEIKYNGITYPVFQMAADSVSMNIFPIQVVRGNPDFITGSEDIAITEEMAEKLFGKEDPIGKTVLMSGYETPVCAVVKSWGKHSNLPFDIISTNHQFPDWSVSGWYTFIRLREKTDSQAFIKKIYEHAFERENIHFTHFVLTPLTWLRYDHPFYEGTVKFNHILLFAVASGLVILCSLFNYLTLFVSRMRMREKEISLRKVCGSSNRHLMYLLSVEYLLTLLLSIFIGLLLVELVQPTFKELAEIQMASSGIYLETAIYSGLIALLSFLISLFPIYYFRRRSLQTVMKSFIVFQFIISIGIIFCTTVMIKQVHYLNHTDRIVERKGKATFHYSDAASTASLPEELKQLPVITSILPGKHEAFIPRTGRIYWTIKEWDDKPANIREIPIEVVASGEQICSYYNLKLLKGRMLKEDDPQNEVMINETAARQFGWKDPIGKTFLSNDSVRMEVIGIIRDFCKEPPTVPVRPVLFTTPGLYTTFNSGNTLLFDFIEGHWKECKSKIETLINEKHPDINYYTLSSAEEEFAIYLQSENALIKLLDFVSVVCILISVFGIFSLVTLNCERRRKEIAVRKVNGATGNTIIRMFLKEYMLLLCIGAAIAFPIGYLIIYPWLQNYVIQTTINAWIYLVLFIAVGIIVTASIIWRIRKAASQNPAEVIKSE